MTKFTVTKRTTFEINCPMGDGGKVVKVGKVGSQQRYRCKSCGRSFRNTAEISKGRQYTVGQIGDALGQYFDGLSFREVSRNIGRSYNITPPAEETVYRWVQAYARAAVKAAFAVKPRTGPEWVADEMAVKVDGNAFWLWNVMDAQTRFILAFHLTQYRTAAQAKIVMAKALAYAHSPPTWVKTDRHSAYPSAVKMVFAGKVKHVKSDGLAAIMNNNLSERLQGTIRERDKVLRGLKRPQKAQEYLEGWMMDYNFFRPHMALKGATPANAAGVSLPFKDWQGVATFLHAKGVTDKAPRAKDMPGYRKGKKLGRPITRRRGRK